MSLGLWERDQDDGETPVPSLSLSFLSQKVNCLLYHTHSCHDMLPHHRPKAARPTNSGLILNQ
jgi:hypothetical protein